MINCFYNFTVDHLASVRECQRSIMDVYKSCPKDSRSIFSNALWIVNTDSFEHVVTQLSSRQRAKQVEVLKHGILHLILTIVLSRFFFLKGG